MPTLTQARAKTTPIIPDNLEETEEYPPELINLLEKEIDMAETQIATGEIRVMTIAEIAAAVGLKR